MFMWVKSEGLVVVVDFVYWLKSGLFILVKLVIEEVLLIIGYVFISVVVYMSYVVVYEMFLILL